VKVKPGYLCSLAEAQTPTVDPRGDQLAAGKQSGWDSALWNMKLQNAVDIERYLKTALACEGVAKAPKAPAVVVEGSPTSGTPMEYIPTKSAVQNPNRKMKTENLETLEPSGPRLTRPYGSAAEPPPGGVRLNEILVPLDMSEMSFKALRYAVSFARQYGAKLTLLHIIPPVMVATEFAAEAPTPRQITALEKELGEIRETRIPQAVAVDTVVRRDFAPEGIVAAARELESDLIIIATHGRTGLKHLMMGSTAEKVARTATCPVLVVRETERDFAGGNCNPVRRCE